MNTLLRIEDVNNNKYYINLDRIEYLKLEKLGKRIAIKMTGGYVIPISRDEWTQLRTLIEEEHGKSINIIESR